MKKLVLLLLSVSMVISCSMIKKNKEMKKRRNENGKNYDETKSNGRKK